MTTIRHTRLALSALVLAAAAPIAAALPPPLPPVREEVRRAPGENVKVRPQNTNASLVFDRDVEELGRIFDHEKKDIEFKFSNQGTEDLVIHNIKPTCGCTLANVYKIVDGEKKVIDTQDPQQLVFAPGEQGVLDLTFDPTGKKGAQDRRVNIMSNDKTSRQRFVSIKAFVRPVVQFDPPLVSFGNVDVGEEQSTIVKVMGISEDFEATRPTFAQLGVFEAEVIGTEEVEFNGDLLQATSIRITAPADLKPATYNTTMHVRTNDERKRIVDIPVFAAIKGPVEVVPPRLAVGNIRAGNPVNRSVIVRSRGGQPFTITDISVDRDDLAGLEFTSRLRTEGDPTQHVVQVSGTLTQPMARTTATLKITTSLKEHNVIELPLVLSVVQ
ncbi:MAG: DUF1573 domain-containing protein [Phycisphaerales bacterium JB040]